MNPHLRSTLRAPGRTALFIFLAGDMLFANPQGPAKPPHRGDPVLGTRIAKGIVADGKLWLRGIEISRKGGPGGLVSLNLAANSRLVHFERGVIDIERSASELWVLRESSADRREYTVSVWQKAAFSDLVRFTTTDGDDPIALLAIAGSPAVLSTGALRIWSGERSDGRVIKLGTQLRRGAQVSVALPKRGRNLFVGANRGEWGGGLQEVNVETGVVANVEDRGTGGLCSGSLNSDCAPVTGVIPDPQNDDCVLAAVGLVHLFTSDGRILRVCGESVTQVFAAPFTREFAGKTLAMTEAFFGLALADDGGFWGITWRALYRFTPDAQKLSEYPLPKSKLVLGVYMNRDIPGVIVVRTDVNWAVSTSGYTPLLVPLETPQSQGGSRQ